MKFTIPGIPPSVNHLYLTTCSGKRIMTKEGRAWMEEARYYLPDEIILDKVDVTLRFYYPDNRRRDLDNSMKVTLDLLPLKDDSQVYALRASKLVDKDNPRVEVEIERME